VRPTTRQAQTKEIKLIAVAKKQREETIRLPRPTPQKSLADRVAALLVRSQRSH